MSCTDEEIHVGDEGVQFKIALLDCEAVVDVSSATVKQIIFRNPDCSIVTKTASFYTDGTDGIIYYTTVAGDLDIPGVWQIQAYVETSSGKYHSSKTTFIVYENLEA